MSRSRQHATPASNKKAQDRPGLFDGDTIPALSPDEFGAQPGAIETVGDEATLRERAEAQPEHGPHDDLHGGGIDPEMPQHNGREIRRHFVDRRQKGRGQNNRDELTGRIRHSSARGGRSLNGSLVVRHAADAGSRGCWENSLSVQSSGVNARLWKTGRRSDIRICKMSVDCVTEAGLLNLMRAHVTSQFDDEIPLQNCDIG